MGDFFDHTVGRRMKASTAHIKLKPETRAALKAEHGWTDEQIDEALKRMSQEATAIAHKDADDLHDHGQLKQRADLARLRAGAKKGKANGPGIT